MAARTWRRWILRVPPTFESRPSNFAHPSSIAFSTNEWSHWHANPSALFRETLNDILGSTLPDLNFELACLPVRKGGLGLNDPKAALLVPPISFNFSFARSEPDLPHSFWEEFDEAWAEIRTRTGLSAEILQLLDFHSGDIGSEDLEAEWGKQKW